VPQTGSSSASWFIEGLRVGAREGDLFARRAP
jgi:hypothetical protein